MSKSNTTESIKKFLDARTEIGLKKYGTSVDRTDLSTIEWMTHHIEELADAIQYAWRAREELIKANTPIDSSINLNTEAKETVTEDQPKQATEEEIIQEIDQLMDLIAKEFESKSKAHRAGKIEVIRLKEAPSVGDTVVVELETGRLTKGKVKAIVNDTNDGTMYVVQYRGDWIAVSLACLLRPLTEKEKLEGCSCPECSKPEDSSNNETKTTKDEAEEFKQLISSFFTNN